MTCGVADVFRDHPAVGGVDDGDGSGIDLAADLPGTALPRLKPARRVPCRLPS